MKQVINALFVVLQIVNCISIISTLLATVVLLPMLIYRYYVGTVILPKALTDSIHDLIELVTSYQSKFDQNEKSIDK